ncbi:hypothetical protein Bbelb_446250 [Branchiostoma belcheri]|nr:hypothetical protein Bbelb_446250 [Branchiostoma belcheri]
MTSAISFDITASDGLSVVCLRRAADLCCPWKKSDTQAISLAASPACASTYRFLKEQTTEEHKNTVNPKRRAVAGMSDAMLIPARIDSGRLAMCGLGKRAASKPRITA